MAGPQIICEPEAVTLDWLLGSAAEVPDDELVSSTVIALCTDKRAKADEELPNPDDDDRRGWWGDTDAELLHDGWPIGSRLWLLSREKITGPAARRGSLTGRIEDYLREAMQPFKDRRICSKLAVSAERIGLEGVDASVTLFRGNTPDIELRFAGIWQNIQA